MKIEYLGHSSFFLQGKDKSVVTDPFEGIGFDLKRVICDYCTVSHNHFDHNFTAGVNAKKIITSSGDGFLAIDSYHVRVSARSAAKTVFSFSKSTE